MLYVRDLNKKELDGDLYLGQFKVRVNLDNVKSRQLLVTKLYDFVHKLEGIVLDQPTKMVDEFFYYGIVIEISRVVRKREDGSTEDATTEKWQQLFPSIDYNPALADLKAIIKEQKKCSFLYNWLQNELVKMVNEVTAELSEEAENFQ